MNFIASTLGQRPKHRTLAEWAKTYSLVVQAKPIQAKTKQNRASHIRRIVNRLGDSATTQGFGACAVGHGLPQLVVGWRSGVLRGWRHALPAPAHVAEGVNLDTALSLAIHAALHTHQAEAATLTAALTLVVSDAIHAHFADQAELFIPAPLVDQLRRPVFLRIAQQRPFVRVGEQRISIRVQ